MKIKKHTIQLSVILMIASLLVLTILQFKIYPYAFRLWLVGAICENASLFREYGIIISGGIFTSAFVTLIISIREYQDARISTLEHYYKVSNDFLGHYKNISYFEPSHPFDIVKGCIWEEEENKRKSSDNKQLKEMIKKSTGKNDEDILKDTYETLSFENKTKMLNFIWKNFIYNCLHDRQRTVLQKIREEA